MSLLIGISIAQAQTTHKSKPSQEVSACLDAAARHYDIDPGLLKAIAKVESGFNPKAFSPSNSNGSRDIGLMQINSRWLHTLAKHGITELDLYKPCTSAAVGAWVLAQNFAVHGPTWKAVGAYNAASPEKRRIYSLRVWNAYQDLAFRTTPARHARANLTLQASQVSNESVLLELQDQLLADAVKEELQ